MEDPAIATQQSDALEATWGPAVEHWEWETTPTGVEHREMKQAVQSQWEVPAAAGEQHEAKAASPQAGRSVSGPSAADMEQPVAAGVEGPQAEWTSSPGAATRSAPVRETASAGSNGGPSSSPAASRRAPDQPPAFTVGPQADRNGASEGRTEEPLTGAPGPALEPASEEGADQPVTAAVGRLRDAGRAFRKRRRS
jgi:hypothetical protein